MSTNLERLRGLEEEQKRHVHASKEDPAHVRAVAEDHAATLEIQREDESTRQAVKVSVDVDVDVVVMKCHERVADGLLASYAKGRVC